jgi:hypothetical protein
MGPPASEYEYPVSYVPDLRKVGRDEYDRGTAGPLLEQELLHEGCSLDIEAAGRVRRQDYAWYAGELACEDDLLLISSGQGLDRSFFAWGTHRKRVNCAAHSRPSGAATDQAACVECAPIALAQQKIVREIPALHYAIASAVLRDMSKARSSQRPRCPLSRMSGVEPKARNPAALWLAKAGKAAHQLSLTIPFDTCHTQDLAGVD